MQTSLSATLEHTGNSSQTMSSLGAVDIQPPVLSSNTFSSLETDFIDQTDLDRRWASFIKEMNTQPLTESGAVAVLRSGVLLRDPCKALAGEFADWLYRSIRPLGSLTEDRLEEIIDVVCHLPDSQWQAALGENIRFLSGKNPEGLAKLIESKLKRSNALHRELILNGKLLSDVHCRSLVNLIIEGRQYIGPNDGELDSIMLLLEDASEVRPTPKDALALLDELMHLLEKDNVRQLPWVPCFMAEVSDLRDQIKPAEEEGQTWLQWLIGPSWLESLVGHPVWPSASMNSTAAEASPVPSSDHSTWPLSAMLAFDRNAASYEDVASNRQSLAKSIVDVLLMVSNAAKSAGATRSGASVDSFGRPDPETSGSAWKNGAYYFDVSPFDPARGQQNPTPADPLTMVTHAIAKADEWFTRNLVPWDSASAQAPDVVIEMEPLVEVYRTTTELLSGPLPVVEDVREQVQRLLQRMAASLVSNGAAVWSSAGALLERHPGRAAGAFAAYMAVSNFYAYWFEPAVEEMVDPLQGVEFTPESAPDEATMAHEHIVEGIDSLFEDFPDFAEQVVHLVSQSKYSDPFDDPQLLEDLEVLLKSTASGTENLTYQDYLTEIATLAALDTEDTALVDGPAIDPVNASDVPLTLSAADLALTANVRNKRSLDDLSLSSNFQTSESGVAAHSSAKWLIEAGQRELDAVISIGPGEEIAPGVTINQAADLFIKDYVELQTVLDPALFVVSFTEDFVAGSDLPVNLKSEVNYKTRFTVSYFLSRPESKNRHASPDKTMRYVEFTLADLLMGQHKTRIEPFETLNVLWPSGYTDGFKSAVESNRLLKDYKERSEKVLSRPEAFDLWKKSFQFKLRHLVTDFLQGEGVSKKGKEIAEKFLKGEIQIRPIAITQGKFSSVFHVSNAVFLSTSILGENARDGLFVFMGGKESVIESPVELFEEDGKSIEECPDLRAALSDRIPLKALLGRDDDDFKYSQGRFVWSWNPVKTFENYKWPYRPIVFGRRDGPNIYGENHDAFKDVYNNVVSKAKSDIDTMTSTSGERFIDGMLDILSESLRVGAIILALPGAPTAPFAFLMGAGASATQYLRGKLVDDPLESARHKSNAVIGMVAQVAAPYIGKTLGKVFSKAVDSRIAGKVLERLRFDVFPREISRNFPKYGHSASSALPGVSRIERWIAPRVRNPWIIQEKIDRKHTGNVLVERLKSLAKGPQVAQRLMDRSRVLFFGNHKNGYVYRGFAMRGDMRSPQEVFDKGFKSNGGQASGYYDTSGMGAFNNGGKNGGWTYLIGGRGIDGEDVLRNANWRAGTGARLGSNPYQISYAQDIPGSNILGAYDPAGKFIPNPSALSRAIEKSVPTPFVEKVPFPIKNVVQNKNSTHTPIVLPQ
ncbi:hypothetical protein DKY63_04750 [Pseudomonas putida]|uniref:Uncharacterized protein n=1 Tax=Pseudomonas putida TaxID=303 RepID=A0A2Z4REH6_PSEPU|nr:hypothetical protein DKY63_04750 [Pseudomonas putida]